MQFVLSYFSFLQQFIALLLELESNSIACLLVLAAFCNLFLQTFLNPAGLLGSKRLWIDAYGACLYMFPAPPASRYAEVMENVVVASTYHLFILEGLLAKGNIGQITFVI